ncbi:RagB/SusD family nutrient uptake outer membrane protein [Pedobacter heparinus]|uniref:RagB/SusD family nutrient uptake outer membrane protein n=1 Tax=Pedobacter heparinus TaxID=984 RepID=UPI002931DF76|nr:RagB/SusD family nutrient uptake outer membrane protein [Pedobacter heparinus]
MIMIYKNIYSNRLVNMCLAITIILAAVLNFSCKKIENVESNHLQTEEQAWKTISDARTNLIGAYALMRSALASDNTQWLMGDLRNGDFVSTSREDLKAIIGGRLNASFPVINNLTNWRRFYAVINACNVFIEQSAQIIQNDARYTKLNNQVDVAQAKALRAFAYFYMVRIWGDVPLILSSSDGNFTQLPRTSKERVLSYCKDDLMASAQVLPFRYGSNDPILPGLYFSDAIGQWNGVTFTKISAYCILAHIAAWQQDYIDCEVYTKFVIDNYPKLVETASNIRYLTINELTGTFSGSNAVNPFFYKRATQLIAFSFEYGFSGATTTGHIEELTLAEPIIPKTQPEIFVPKDSIRAIFTDRRDFRFSVDSVATADAKRNDPFAIVYQPYYFTNYTSQRPIFSKIRAIGNADQPSGKFLMYSSAILFTRLEEITLLRAEALAVLGQRLEAIRALNRAAQLRNTTPYAENSTKDLITEIFAERRRELMGEGWRWYDLIRYNRLKNLSGPFIYKNGVPLTFAQAQAQGGIYWPVSQEVINNNPAITQNAFWQ